MKLRILRSLAALTWVLLSGVLIGRAAPANDNFSTATFLTGTNLAIESSNVGASKEVGEPDHGANSGGASVWWRWTAPSKGSLIVRTDGSSIDTLLAAYSGGSLSSLSNLAGNDDAGSLATSVIGFNVDSGVTYAIAVDGYGGATGTIRLALEYRPLPLVRPANDSFAGRIALTGPTVSIAGSNFFATEEPGEPNHADELGGSSVWWTWTAPQSGDVLLTTHGSTVDTLLAVYTGAVLTNLVRVASNDDVSTNDPTSRVTFRATANSSYQIAVDGFDGEPGDIQLHLSMPDLFAMGLAPTSGGGVIVRITGLDDFKYSIESSSDLTHWIGLTNGTGTFEVFESINPLVSKRYFRGRRAP